MNRFSILVGVGIASVGLAGCADSEPDSSQSTSQAPPTTPPQGEKPEVEATAVEPDPLTCLHGTWLADNSFFLKQIQEFGDEVQSVNGRVLLQFAADGTLTTEYEDWTISAVSEGAEVQIVRSGVDVGTFNASDSTVELNDTQIGSTLTMKRGSLEMAIDPHPAAYAEAPYTCNADDARIDTTNGALQLARQSEL